MRRATYNALSSLGVLTAGTYVTGIHWYTYALFGAWAAVTAWVYYAVKTHEKEQNT